MVFSCVYSYRSILSPFFFHSFYNWPLFLQTESPIRQGHSAMSRMKRSLIHAASALRMRTTVSLHDIHTAHATSTLCFVTPIRTRLLSGLSHFPLHHVNACPLYFYRNPVVSFITADTSICSRNYFHGLARILRSHLNRAWKLRKHNPTKRPVLEWKAPP